MSTTRIALVARMATWTALGLVAQQCAPSPSVPTAAQPVAVAAPAKHYVCTPCGAACDDAVYDHPGTCPACGMPLVEQGAPAAPAAPAEGIADYITAAVNDPGRPESDRQRDASQQPAELLAFAGVKPGDRIADFWPAPPYSTRLLGRVAGPSGRVYAILPRKTVADSPGADADTRKALAPYANVSVLVEPFDAFSVPEPLDVVWMGKIYHDLPNVTEMGPVDIAAMNRAIFQALKPGGVYVVVDHAAVAGSGYLDTEPDMRKRLHRIDPKVVEAQVSAAGFVLEARSTLLSNPDDDHLKSVFDPRISGKTDRFVFKFRKPVPSSSRTEAALRAAVAGAHRPDKEKARDRWLHPVETLEFFGLRDDMTVVELSPDKGQWTAVLGPVLREHGKLRIASGDRFSEWTRSNELLADRLTKDAGVFGRVETVKTNWARCDVTLGPDASADMVVTFRNMHDWLGAEVADKVLDAVHAVLKPGGTFGLTDHRGKPGAPTDPRSISDEGGAYVPQAFMIETVQKHGFELVGTSEVNANPKDTKDWPRGALTLPPQLAMGDKDRAKYVAVGETDCMTLRFVRR